MDEVHDEATSRDPGVAWRLENGMLRWSLEASAAHSDPLRSYGNILYSKYDV